MAHSKKEEKAREVERTWETEVPVPQHSYVTVSATVQKAKFAVPYTIEGVYTLESGKKLKGHADGTQTGEAYGETVHIHIGETKPL